jgi:hypothetical protein
LGWLILRYTMIGRGIFAIGGDLEAAKRVGFNVKVIQFFVYSDGNTGLSTQAKRKIECRFVEWIIIHRWRYTIRNFNSMSFQFP